MSNAAMKPFTVIGVYQETGEPFADHVKATDAKAAIACVANDRGEWALFAGAVEGHVTLLSGDEG